jgi:hypothetical protein
MHHHYNPSTYEQPITTLDIAAFRRRQQQDLKRYKPHPDDDDDISLASSRGEEETPTRSQWTNSDGDTLKDFGVASSSSEDDDNIPLGELLRRRRADASQLVELPPPLEIDAEGEGTKKTV